MPTPQEPDFPAGHPARCDYDPSSPEAQEWARRNIHPKGERDFPVDHPKALDTPGNQNHVAFVAGVDPARPTHEAFTGRSPEQAEAARQVYAQLSKDAKETVTPIPTIALDPPRAVNVMRAQAAPDGNGISIFCPGCESLHTFDARWTFNGSMELPTFSPSLMLKGDANNAVCHSFVTNGRIQFLPDSTHKLSGQTVDLPAIAQAKGTINGTRS